MCNRIECARTTPLTILLLASQWPPPTTASDRLPCSSGRVGSDAVDLSPAKKRTSGAVVFGAHSFCSLSLPPMTHMMCRPMTLCWPDHLAANQIRYVADAISDSRPHQLPVAFAGGRNGRCFPSPHSKRLITAFIPHTCAEPGRPELLSRAHCMTSEIASQQSPRPRPNHAYLR